jgi:beta-glucosidase
VQAWGRQAAAYRPTSKCTPPPTTTTTTQVPILYGIDSVHGANYVSTATMFPHPINVAASFNRTVAGTVGAVAAKDSRSAGLHWMFAPVLGISTNPEWGRTYETLGEDPFLASEMGVAFICAAQGGCPARQLSQATSAAACMKHFIGYPATRSGQDRTPAWVPWRHLLQYYAPPFWSAVARANVSSAMESYSEVDGVPMASSNAHLVVLLRQMMNFTGLLVTDWAEIENQWSWHHVSASPVDAVARSIARTSIDMSMASGQAQAGGGGLQTDPHTPHTRTRLPPCARRCPPTPPSPPSC